MKIEISVIVIVKNGEKYIQEALQSLRRQTVDNFEIVIVNDCSNDQTNNLIDQFRENNPSLQLTVVENENTMGIAASRNIGLGLSKGNYIAWLDHDDVFYADKLKVQFEFLELNKDFAMVGTNVDVIDNCSVVSSSIIYGFDPLRIKVHLFFMNYFTQSSVMIRRVCLEYLMYDREMEPAEDYSLWIDLSMKYKLWNLPYTLTAYRVHGSNITITKNEKLRDSFALIIKKNLRFLNLHFSETEFEMHLDIINSVRPNNYSDLKLRYIWLSRLSEANRNNCVYDKSLFEDYLNVYWNNSLISVNSFSPKVLILLFKEMSRTFIRQFSVFACIKLIFKSLISYKNKL
jgi:glycosyltransferase involved in cell wall biosynthesis